MKLAFFEKFLNPTSIRHLPWTVTRKNTYILPTRHGLMFLLVLAAMLAGSINYNNNLGFLLVFLLGSMAVVSMVHTHRNLMGLKILSVSARPVFAGETAVFIFLISPEGYRRNGLEFFFERPRSAIENLTGDAEARILVRAAAPKRGLLAPDPLTVSTCFPLGLFYAWTRVGLNCFCTVYPKPIAAPFEFNEITEGGTNQDTAPVLSGTDDFLGLKVYQPGDPVRRISWKTLSRGQGLFSKEFAGRGGNRPVFDYEQMTGRDTETRLSQLCDLVRRAAAANMEYGLNLPGYFIAPDRGREHRHRCLKTLAQFGINQEPGDK
ncbi:MAG: DUF58 domain-containing protein [Desulfosalsimonas sp.]|uniref:DUF58 domain-containing protein n=1 Tax=Desulfosalsimonas sp. TaxID=3073848 RepID=UPI003970C340